MNFNVNFGFGNNKPLSVERNANGDWFYSMFSSLNNSKQLKSNSQKIESVLTNPAMLTAFSLNCDLFSLGKINLKTKTDVSENHLRTILKKPNLKQNWTQFYWDYCFYNMLGTAYLWSNYNKVNKSSSLIWLNPANIQWESNVLNKLKNIILDGTDWDLLLKETVKYNLGNGQSEIIPLSEIIPIHDLTSGVSGNPYKGISRIDALYKIINNTESTLDATAKNLEFSQKFMASGKMNDLTSLRMDDTEKESIENILQSNKSVHAVKSQIDIKRFVDDIANLKLSETYFSQFEIICKLFGIPKELYDGDSKYVNLEKAIGRHVEYVLKPKAQNLTDVLEEKFGLTGLEMEWNHLGFNQVFETERNNANTIKLDNLQKAVDLGMDEKTKQQILETIKF